MAMVRAAIPLNMAPTTKYGPNTVECHPGTTAIAKSQDTIECTETATGMIATVMIVMAVSRQCHSRGVPCQPRARTV